MSNNNKNTTKKKSTSAQKKPVAKKKAVQNAAKAIQGKKIQIAVPTADEFKDLLSDTFAELQKDNFKVTSKTKKGFFARVKSWFKTS